MCSQQSRELLQKRHFSMVLFLISDVLTHRSELRLTDGKRAVAGLPREVSAIGQMLAQPMRYAAFTVRITAETALS
jgi:hypothetical protein